MFFYIEKYCSENEIRKPIFVELLVVLRTICPQAFVCTSEFVVIPLMFLSIYIIWLGYFYYISFYLYKTLNSSYEPGAGDKLLTKACFKSMLSTSVAKSVKGDKLKILSKS